MTMPTALIVVRLQRRAPFSARCPRLARSYDTHNFTIPAVLAHIERFGNAQASLHITDNACAAQAGVFSGPSVNLGIGAMPDNRRTLSQSVLDRFASA